MGYEDVKAEFAKHECQLLTTLEEWTEKQKNKDKSGNVKYKYIASCGHEHEVFYNVFKSRGTGRLCPKCQSAKQASEQKKHMAVNPLEGLETEHSCIKHIIENSSATFTVRKLFDGCKADLAIRPIDISEDKWVGIQVKSTKSIYKDNYFSFHIMKKDYTDVHVLCMSLKEKKMWLFPYEIVKGLIKLSIGNKSSKYDAYEIENLHNSLKNCYSSEKVFKFDELNTPICIFQQRELHYRILREAKIDFLDFEYPGLEGTVYDFKINDMKIQEKVGGIGQKNNHIFHLCKNNGRDSNGKRLQSCYAQHDSDYYWLNLPDKNIFFVIPEDELIDRNLIGKTNKAKSIFSIAMANISKQWYHKYMFTYNDIDKEKLCRVLKC
jgi:hypothetical protein